MNIYCPCIDAVIFDAGIFDPYIAAVISDMAPGSFANKW